MNHFSYIAGAIVKCAEDRGVGLDALTLADMQAVEPAITQEVFSVLSRDASVKARMSYGGTAPDRVREQLRFWKEKLK